MSILEWLRVDWELTSGMQPLHLSRLWNRYIQQAGTLMHGQPSVSKSEMESYLQQLA